MLRVHAQRPSPHVTWTVPTIITPALRVCPATLSMDRPHGARRRSSVGNSTTNLYRAGTGTCPNQGERAMVGGIRGTPSHRTAGQVRRSITAGHSPADIRRKRQYFLRHLPLAASGQRDRARNVRPRRRDRPGHSFELSGRVCSSCHRSNTIAAALLKPYPTALSGGETATLIRGANPALASSWIPILPGQASQFCLTCHEQDPHNAASNSVFQVMYASGVLVYRLSHGPICH